MAVADLECGFRRDVPLRKAGPACCENHIHLPLIGKSYELPLQPVLVIRQKNVLDNFIAGLLQDFDHERTALILIGAFICPVGQRYDAGCERSVRIERQKFHLIARLYHSLFEHFCKYSLARHYTIPHTVIDGAVVMALFADLSEAKDSIAAPHDRPDRDIPEINTLKDEVFTEGAEGDICTFRAELLDLLEGKKADLAVPFARVGVTLDAPFGDQVSFGYLIFLRSFFIASAYSKYFSCHDSTSVIMLRTSFSQVMGFYSHAVLQLLWTS